MDARAEDAAEAAAAFAPVAGAPAEPWARLRPLPGVRAVRVTLRTAHLVAFAAFYGGHWHAVDPERLHPALAATVLTGGALMALEMYRAPVWPMQIRGLATLVKIVLVATAAAVDHARVPLLTTALVLGDVGSHMPGRFRYYSVVHGRVIGGTERG